MKWNNFFKKFKSYAFWVSLSSALVILLNSLGHVFGFEIENKVVEDCVLSVAGVLVVLGIVVKPENGTSKDKPNSSESEQNDPEKDLKDDEK